jgi:hypothetical protein
MDIKSKIKSVEMHVRMISRADDTDSAIRGAALDAVVTFVEQEREAMKGRLNEQMAKLEGDQPA